MATVITGATGLIGRALIRRIDEPIVLSRDPTAAKRTLGGIEVRQWSGATQATPAEALHDAGVVVNLAGEPVAEGRWTDAKKKRIRDSRVLGTRNLVAALRTLDVPPRVFVSASAVGFYGDRGDEELDESASGGSDFLASVCAEWEAEAMRAQELGTRVVCVRIGVVLAGEGGALSKMLTPFRLGLGGKVGSGRQWMPWIHLDDVIGLILHAVTSDAIRGPLNVAAPNPVTNAEFTRALAAALHRPAVFTVPQAALRFALGEMSEIVIGSQRVRPRMAQETGYSFAYSNLKTALASVLRLASTSDPLPNSG